jgi:hypothetical protein
MLRMPDGTYREAYNDNDVHTIAAEGGRLIGPYKPPVEVSTVTPTRTRPYRRFGRQNPHSTRATMRSAPSPLAMPVDADGTPVRVGPDVTRDAEVPAKPKRTRMTRAQRLAQYRVEHPEATKGQWRASEGR